jgi:hypothetical protein
MDFNVIYDFCKVRNYGTAMKNGTKDYPPRVKFLLDLLDNLNIKYEIDTFKLNGSNLHNIYLKGTTNKWVMAHHDVCNHTIDNANDNSASVINAIALKTYMPEINVALVDGEEPPCMGAGSSHFAERFKNGEITADYVLNLELTGSGGKNFFIGSYKTDLTKKIAEKFNCAVWNVPFNDAAVLISKANINAALINPCPLKEVITVKQVGDANGNDNNDKGENDEVSNKIENLERELSDIYDKMYKIDIDDEEEYLDLEERSFEIEMEISNLESEKSGISIGSFFDFRNFSKKFKRNIKVGDNLSKWEYENILKDLPNNNKLDDNDPKKFIVDKSYPELNGRMPKIEEMDTSILGRCHTREDHVGHLRPNEMKEFVEEVLVPIFREI